MNLHNDITGYDVSLVLCTKNRAKLLDEMLASLPAAATGVRYEVIVVEGGSTDNTRQILSKHGVTNIYNEADHFGPGRHSWPKLYNFGFAKARGRYAMYASDDIVFGPGCISDAVEILNAQQDSVAGGVFFYRNLHTRPDWDKFGIDFTYGHKLLMNYGLVRLDRFRQAGGLDESYRFYCADGDLCFKLYESGFQLIPLSGCLVTHNNILDVQKQANAEISDLDISRYKNRWRHFVPMDETSPKRILWHRQFGPYFNIPAELRQLDSSIDQYFHALSQFQYRQFDQAKENLVRAVNAGCDHWLICWLGAQAANLSGDKDLAKQFARAVLKTRPDFTEAQNLLWQLSPDHVQSIQTAPNTLYDIQKSNLWSPGKPLRLHLGCGKFGMDGYVNIDYPITEHTTVKQLGADLHADITTLRFPAQTVDEIRLHHVFEHFNRVTALELLIRWANWLKTGGRLHIETPDLIGSAKTLLSNASWKTKMGVVRHLAGDQAAKWAYHVDHWFGERFEHTLTRLGFGQVQVNNTTWTHEPYLSNVEIIAEKSVHVPIARQFAAAEEILWESTVSPKEKPMWEIWTSQLKEQLADIIKHQSAPPLNRPTKIPALQGQL